MELFVRILLIPVGLLAVAFLPIIGTAILGPISRSAGLLKAPTRFQLSDFVWLLVSLQAVLSVVVQFVGVETRGLFVVVLLYLTFAASALWAGAVSFLSRAAVVDPWRRAAFTLFILPVTLALMIGLPGASIYTMIQTTNRMLRYGWYPGWLELTAFILGGMAILVAVPTFIWLLRRASLWVIAGSTLPLPSIVRPPANQEGMPTQAGSVR